MRTHPDINYHLLQLFKQLIYHFPAAYLEDGLRFKLLLEMCIATQRLLERKIKSLDGTPN